MLGAGPAGLGAAYRLAKGGRRVTLLERAGRVGGASASHTVSGIRVDFGSHRLHPSIDPRILGDLQDLLGDELQRRVRNGRIRLAGRWIAFPLGAADLLKNLPRSFAARVAAESATSFARRPREDSFSEVLRAGLGPTICERFYFPYARKIWGRAPDELSGDQARKRVSASTPLAILKRVMRGSGSGGAEGAGYFWYPAGGYGRISEVLADAASSAGADIQLNAAVTSVEVRSDGVSVTAGERTYEARDVWSTIPMPVLVRLLDPAAPEEVADAAKALKTRAMTLVYLTVEGDRFTPFDAHYLPEGWTPVTRISEPKNYRSGDDPAGITVLCAEIPCDVGDDVWTADEPSLEKTVRDALAGAELPVPKVTAVHIERLPNAYPILRRGYEKAFDTVDGWLMRQDRLLTFGRQGLFAHDNAHHALAMAWAAADALSGNGLDRSKWADARATFKAHVVED